MDLSSDLITLANKCLTPSIHDLIYRPMISSDFDIFKQHLDSNLQNIIMKFDHREQGDLSREIIAYLILIIGEQQGNFLWATKTMNIRYKLLAVFDEIMSWNELLLKPILISSLNKLKSKLTREVWKCNPASITCVTFLTTAMLKKFSTVEVTLINLLLPSILLQVDDFEMQYKINGLRILQNLLESSSERAIFREGRRDVILDAVKGTLYTKDDEVLRIAIICLGILLDFQWPVDTDNWSRYDQVIDAVLNRMYLETTLSTRALYINVLPRFLKNIRNRHSLWLKRLLDIYENYLDTSVLDNYIDEYVLCGISQCISVTLEHTNTFSFMYDGIIDQAIVVLFRLLNSNIDHTKKQKSVQCLTTSIASMLIYNTKKFRELEYIFRSNICSFGNKEYMTLWKKIYNMAELMKK